jgi:hypothetical protein
MVLPASVRAEKLRALRADEGKAIGKQKLFYKDETQWFNVYRIDLDYVIYNRHNGRIESEMLTWEFEHAIGPTDYNDEIHKLIDTFLWESNVERNKHTLRDLQEKQQQRPGIVSLDGVLIDGNRRAMLLKRIGSGAKYIESIILPDEYHEDEKAIVRLETEYQIGEDSKLDYGPLEKYLKVKRLTGLGYDNDEIAGMMAESRSEVERLLRIMSLMDDYLAHIDCTGLYKMLKEADGSTKEGMFVDLYQDLKRLNDGNATIAWPYDPLEVLELQTIQFDHIRAGTALFPSGKDYREISHDGRGERTFFAKESIWKPFRDDHRAKVDPVTASIGTLSEYIAKNPQFPSRVEAAEARDDEWRKKTDAVMKGNFGRMSDKLSAELDADKPRLLLERALASLERVNFEGDAFINDASNLDLVKQINSIGYEMKKRFDRKKN